MKNIILVMSILLACSGRAQSVLPKEGDGSFGVLGAAIGSPSGISFVGGYYTDHWALRISGGGWQKGWYGAQADIAYSLNRGLYIAHGVSVVTGRFGSRTFDDTQQAYVQQSQSYVGFAYDLYLSGLFLQTGLGFGSGKQPEYANPIVLFQAGYLFHF